MATSKNSSSIVIRLCGPHHSEFLVQIQDSSGLQNRFLSKREFKTLLILIRAFLCEKTKIVDLTLASECTGRSSAQKWVSQLRKALDDSEHSLVVHDGETFYRLNVSSIEDGDGFRLCRGVFGSDIDAIIDEIIRAIIESLMTGKGKRLATVPKESSFSFVQTQFVGTIVIQAGCASELIVCDSLSVSEQITVLLR